MDLSGPTRRRNNNRVRKRVPNACTRCRRQKTRCSGSHPCDQCVKRNVSCSFDDEHQKVLVTKSFLAHLEQQANLARSNTGVEAARDTARNNVEDEPDANVEDDLDTEPDRRAPRSSLPSTSGQRDTERDAEDAQTTCSEERCLVNPLTTHQNYTAYPSGRPSYLGSSSNWAFGRRILTDLHQRIYGTPPAAVNLLFDGATYDLGWDGTRAAMLAQDEDQVALPTPDFALFLVNAVKFHCGQLFHLFDEDYFMRRFAEFHNESCAIDNSNNTNKRERDSWYVHYCLILALGKAFIVRRVGKDKRPPGAELYVHAMKLLPDVTLLCADPVQSVEMLCCAALYLQCLDMRTAAYNLLGQAMRIAVVEGLHTDMDTQHHSPASLERCREIWWTVYVLDCHMSSLMGVPFTLNERDITARLPAFNGACQKTLALSVHVKLAKVTATILQTVYSSEGKMDDRFVASIRTALKSLAEVNDERTRAFPIDPKRTGSGTSRRGAYLHLFHHNCIIITTRPLLFSFFQRHLQRTSRRRISSAGGIRSLLRVCVASAQSIIHILALLQSQGLLESFIPFDLESVWSAALVLLISSEIDHSLVRTDADTKQWPEVTNGILDEMIGRGNLVAQYHKDELEQIQRSFSQLAEVGDMAPANLSQSAVPVEGLDNSTGPEFIPYNDGSTASHASVEPLQGWNSEDSLSGEQLIALADSLNTGSFDWLSWASLIEHDHIEDGEARDV